MRLKPFLAPSITLILLLLSQVSRCWVCPDLHEDGVYQFTYLARGNWWELSPNVTQYKIDPDIPVVPLKSKSKWPNWLAIKDCFDKEEELDADDLHRAENALMRWCEKFDPKARSIVVSLINNATVYTSYWDYGTTYLQYKPMGYCSAQDIQYASAMMKQKCGFQHASEVHLTFLRRFYGQALKGANIMF